MAADPILAQTTTTTYSYDPLGRLTTASYSTCGSATYSYDQADNRTNLTQTASAASLTAGSVSVTTTGNTATTFSPLSSDCSPQSLPISITGVSNPSHGSATLSGSAITYTPTSGYSGADSFSYSISDGHGGTSTGSVSVTVTPAAQPPVAVNQSYSVLDTVPSATLNVLSGDSSPQGYTLTIIGVGTPSLGSVSINSGGTALTYVPVGDGTDTFTYTISDGHGGTATATVTVKVKVGGCKYC